MDRDGERFDNVSDVSDASDVGELEILGPRFMTLTLPQKGDVKFSLVASLPTDTDWEDIEGIMYELGGDFADDATETEIEGLPRLVLQPTEEGLFAVVERDDVYELFLSEGA